MNVKTIHIPFDEELLPIRTLQFGRFSCMYEHGRIRCVQAGNIELIRMIYFAVRDKEWNTASYTIRNELIETKRNGFTISYEALHTLDDVSYQSIVSIIAVDDTLSFSVTGEALSNFQRNRIGICVLHPIKECKGKDVVIERPDGTKYKSTFPDLISPHQPFMEIGKMHCTINTGSSVDLHFEGDVFETEDQRNWADSSFKTYSTPLNIPFPVRVNQGDTLQQKVELKFTSNQLIDDNASFIRERKNVFPKVGYGTGNDAVSENEIKLLSKLPFDHYRVELSLKDVHWKEMLDARMNEAIRMKTPLELVLIFDEDSLGELEKLIAAIDKRSSLISSILILNPAQTSSLRNELNIAYVNIKERHPDIEVGYGTNGFFADINRNRPPLEALFDFLSFPLTPQVHSFDTRSVLENLERQQDLLETAHSFAPGKKIYVSPITFKIRSASTEASGVSRDYDARQHRNFGAWWTLCTIRNLSGADRLSFYTITRGKGVLSQDPGNLPPSPLYTALSALKAFVPTRVIQDDGSNRVWGKITFENDAGDRLEFVLDSGNSKNL